MHPGAFLLCSEDSTFTADDGFVISHADLICAIPESGFSAKDRSVDHDAALNFLRNF
jgi:hypothetical protein